MIDVHTVRPPFEVSLGSRGSEQRSEVSLNFFKLFDDPINFNMYVLS